MSYIVEFAGLKLSNFCKVLNVTRSVLPTRENYNKKIPNMHGSYYTGFCYSEKSIILECGFVAISKQDYIEKIRRLAKVLDTKKPSKLIISDEPLKYQYAVINGDIEIDKVFHTGKIEIEFLCHDPFAYSNEWKSVHADSRGIFTFENEGTADTNIFIDARFKKSACFFQCTNPKGETILIGKPKDATQPDVAPSSSMVDDACTNSNTFTSIAGSLLDSERVITGQYGVGLSGEGIICTNYGNGEDRKWTGAGFKRPINRNISEFEVTIDFVFSSEGEHYVVPEKPPVKPEPPSPEFPKPPPSYGLYRVMSESGLVIREDKSLDSKVMTTMPYGLETRVYVIEGGWAKVRYTALIGWCEIKYLQKVEKSSEKTLEEKATAEEQLGLLEVYGFEQNGAKLFKMLVTDVNPYYEYVQPEGYIGTTPVIHDNQTCPEPNKQNIVDDDGKVTGNQSVPSGAFGNWNDFVGKMIITRQKNSSNKYLWNMSMHKYVNGNLVRSLGTENYISNSEFPVGDLNYLGFYIGRRDNATPQSVVAVTNIEVKQLNLKTDDFIVGNMMNFNKNDNLRINFETGLVTLNGLSILPLIDIGSEFFKLPTGRSQIICRSDDRDVEVICGFQERFL